MKKLIYILGIAAFFSIAAVIAGLTTLSQEKNQPKKAQIEARDTVAANSPLADSIVDFGLSFQGLHYYYTGKTPATGFDCSGFTHFIFGRFGIELSPASKEQIFAGVQVPIEKVKKGDLLIFTGTKVAIREPGHVGIVISEPGETPVRFVHSSSNGGVKISEVQGTRYADRLLQVRRLF
jgi:cell wall-associated NlpC family hydrolase